jgi:hypothetical protein
MRICVDGAFDPVAAPSPLRHRLARALGLDDFALVEPLLQERQAACRADFVAIVGPLGDGTTKLSR